MDIPTEIQDDRWGAAGKRVFPRLAPVGFLCQHRASMLNSTSLRTLEARWIASLHLARIGTGICHSLPGQGLLSRAIRVLGSDSGARVELILSIHYPEKKGGEKYATR